MSSATSELRRAFEAGKLEPRDFSHRDHLTVAYEMLKRYDFVDATARYGKRLQDLASRAGVPKKYNVTLTFAFMSLIAERMGERPHTGVDSFLADNPDLMSKELLTSWYSPARLQSDLARNVFLMPDVPRSGPADPAAETDVPV